MVILQFMSAGSPVFMHKKIKIMVPVKQFLNYCLTGKLHLLYLSLKIGEPTLIYFKITIPGLMIVSPYYKFKARLDVIPSAAKAARGMNVNVCQSH